MRELGNKFDIGTKEGKEPKMTFKDPWRMGLCARVQAWQKPQINAKFTAVLFQESLFAHF
jgi:hypothetical protein